MVDAGAADPAAADTEKDEPHGAQDYRTRVEEAQLPDDVGEAAPREVGKLERTGEQSAESGDIETWLDTMFDGTDRATFLLDELLDGAPRSGVPVPSSANTPHLNTIPPDAQPQSPTDLEIEQKIRSLIEGAREPDPPAADTEKVDTETVDLAAVDTENFHTENVDQAAADTTGVDGERVDPPLMGEITWPVPPWAADTEMVYGEKVHPAAAEVEEKPDTAPAEVEKPDTAPAGLHDDDTVERPVVLAGLIGDPHPPQLPEPQAHGPVPVQNPAEKRRLGSLALAVTALVALIIGALLFGASRDGGMAAQSSPTFTPTTTATMSKPTSVPSDESTDTEGKESTIQLEDLADSARPFQTVRIEGTHRGGAATFLRVQRWEGGEWISFPLPTKTDQFGRFTAYVEFGQPGRYRLRVLDPGSGLTSKTFVLMIKA
jgi:hypothetical protein